MKTFRINLRIVTYLIVVCFLIVATAPILHETVAQEKTQGFTHTVFVEYASTTWCHYCPTAASQLQELYSCGEYNFVYVSLVADKNPKAGLRCGELGLTGYPTTFFDGGYRGIVGAQGNTTSYIETINECGARTDVHALDVDLHVRAHGDGGLCINLTIAEKDGETYSGLLRVYVTEMVSRWSDNEGKPYHFAMLDYAINQGINIPSMGISNFTVTWDGVENGFDIDPSNIMVVAALYDSHTGYVDNAAYATIYSDLPDTQITEGPKGVVNDSTVSFTWTGSDKNNSVLQYSYMLTPLDAVWSNWTLNTSVTYQNLDAGEYTFRVKARNSKGEEDPLPATRSFAVQHGVPPVVKIKKPGGSMYINNRWVSIPLSLVIGDVDIKADAFDGSGIEKVDFYVDDKLIHEDYYSPYLYSMWHDLSLFPKKHVIRVVAYDAVGITSSDEVTIWRIL